MRKSILIILVLVAGIGLVLLYNMYSSETGNTHTDIPAHAVNTALRHVGVNACNTCHKAEVKAWQGSHHDLAMQHADANTVIADFDHASFQKDGITSRFYRKDSKFFVNTDGPDGKLSDYEIKYTFGVTPLQQYLVHIGNGRLQALSIAWDSRPEQQGGQRWFHLYPNEKIDHNDELHWTKLSQNWNHMCAECHSTNLQKKFDLEKQRFDTTWSEINVSCEACHGPASRHVDWANKKPGWQGLKHMGLANLFSERKGVSWQFAAGTHTATRSQPRATNKEIDTCGRCHSRRSTLKLDYQHGKPLQDSHLPALLTEQLYHPDGQIKEEVYVYGSFLQSKMFHEGVTCSDCHEPHSLQLRAPGNNVCLQCHQTDKYNAKSHHFHEQGSEGASCAECHMPPSNFMVIDGRHDHSIRIPRPDLSEKMNTPNACNQCHADKTPQWANKQMQDWYGKDWAPGWHFGETLFEARQGQPQAGQDLAAVALSPKLPDIARASATSMLSAYPGRLTFTILPKLLTDKSAAVRQAALQTVDQLPAERRWQLAGTLLSDPVYAVRIEAGSVLAGVDRNSLTLAQQQLLDKAIQEYIQSQLANAEHPQSHVNLGLVYQRTQQFAQAHAAYEQALQLDSAYAAAYVNLADLYRSLRQDDKAEAILLKARSILGGNADVEHALGLHYVRSKQMPKALTALANAAQWRPENARYAYVYAVALHTDGQSQLAIKTLEKVHVEHPYDRDVLIALISYAQQRGDVKTATRYAQALIDIDPQFGSVPQLLQQLSSQ